MLDHILVGVLSLDFKQEGVCVGLGELAMGPILGLQVVGVEVVHTQLGEVQDKHTNSLHKTMWLLWTWIAIKDVCLGKSLYFLAVEI